MRPIVNMSEKDRATDTGNMRKKFGKDRACGSGDILADRQTQRQTDIHTHHNTSQPLPRAKYQRGNVHRALIGDGRSQLSLLHRTHNRELNQM